MVFSKNVYFMERDKLINNPLMANIKLPGRIFQLPSKAMFYKNGELSDDIKDGEIHIMPMSAMDEITMRNVDQIFSGDGINAILKNCVKGIEKPAELLSKDIDAILFFLRVVTYGQFFEFNATHTCENAKSHVYTADIESIISSMKFIDPTLKDTNYSVTLPNEQVVKLRPAIYQNVIDLIKMNEAKKEITVDDYKNNLFLTLRGIIVSVDGITDKQMISEWIQAIPSPYVNRILKRMDELNDWGANTLYTCTCKDCGEKFELELPINISNFFTE